MFICGEGDHNFYYLAFFTLLSLRFIDIMWWWETNSFMIRKTLVLFSVFLGVENSFSNVFFYQPGLKVLPGLKNCWLLLFVWQKSCFFSCFFRHFIMYCHSVFHILQVFFNYDSLFLCHYNLMGLISLFLHLLDNYTTQFIKTNVLNQNDFGDQEVWNVWWLAPFTDLKHSSQLNYGYGNNYWILEICFLKDNCAMNDWTFTSIINKNK